MTAEDRHSVDGLSRLLRDEVEQAMLDRSGLDRSGQAASAGESERPVWLGTGEQQLLRAMRASALPISAGRSAAGVFSRNSRVRTWLLAALVAGGVGIGAGLVTLENASRADGPALTFIGDAGPGGDADPGRDAGRRSGRVIAPADRAEDVRFSDGSRFTLAAGSMLRVRETDAHGAMVIVEEGQVESSVRHTSKARWSVFAGPYEVRVVGTRFSTAWDPERQRLSVVLHEGSVQVLGKGIEELVELKPGQRFDSGGSEGKWFVTATASPSTSDQLSPGANAEPANASSDAALNDAVSNSAMPADGRAPGAVNGTGRDTRANAASDRDVAGPSWSALVASGKFEQVLDEVSVAGEGACLSSCSIADLRALADAARYTGRFTLAERALSRLRTLAPSEAPRAGFLLGSMHEAQGRPSAALEWYGRYLEEAPGGGLAAEARAGRMRALLALGQTEAAKAAAKDYLRLHPAGVGANTARQILHRP